MYVLNCFVPTDGLVKTVLNAARYLECAGNFYQKGCEGV